MGLLAFDRLKPFLPRQHAPVSQQRNACRIQAVSFGISIGTSCPHGSVMRRAPGMDSTTKRLT
jgi:hypothetical protein